MALPESSYDVGYIIGFTASAIVILSFLKQQYTIYLRKSAQDLDWTFVIFQLMANMMFLTCGVLQQTLVMIVTNGILTLLLSIMVAQKYYYDHQYYYQQDETQPLLDPDP